MIMSLHSSFQHDLNAQNVNTSNIKAEWTRVIVTWYMLASVTSFLKRTCVAIQMCPFSCKSISTSRLCGCKQRRLRRDCAVAQTRLSLRCSHALKESVLYEVASCIQTPWENASQHLRILVYNYMNKKLK